MILDEIVARKKKDLARRREEIKIADLKARCRSAPPPRGFAPAISTPDGPQVIAEIKRATPRGPLNPKADAPAQARKYADGGAAAVSCLTDVPFFQTSLDDLRDARRAVALPFLRKDFTIDEYQLYETRAALADAALLIVRLCTPSQLEHFLGLGHELGLDLLVEAHDPGEVERALDAGAKIVGINARDLDTFRVDLGRVAEYRRGIPAGCITVAESGVRTRDDMALLAAAGFHAVLIGEELMTHPDPAKRIAELRGKKPA